MTQKAQTPATSTPRGAPPRAFKPAAELRSEFIAFFEEKGHTFVRSSPVVPQDDPTLLFSNAGMNQFKDIFLATGTRAYTRAVNSQKCIRASGKHNDLEDVGRDNYHHTFFEMLGNWSFGDYFKREAIAWAFELLTARWGLDPERMYATVFEGSPAEQVPADDEAAGIWTSMTSIPEARVLRCSKKDNFWEMGESGPCGPCSEIHYDLGAGTCPKSGRPASEGGHTCAVNVDGCWRFIELWNLVFIQYNRLPGGELKPLPAKHVDTGMGLERICRVIQGVDSNYATDLFTPLLAGIARVTGKKDGPGETGVAFRVIADHLRSLSFAIADGALPSNEGRGYVLRRMLRRAARFGKLLGMSEAFIYKLVPDLVAVMGDAFPEVRAQQDHVARVIHSEEESFALTLDRGLDIFEGSAGQLQQLLKPALDVQAKIQASLKPMQESAKRFEESLNPMRELAKSFEKTLEPHRELALKIQESLKPVQESAKRFEESFRPVRELAKSIEKIFAPQREFALKIQESLKPAADFARHIQESLPPMQEMSKSIEKSPASGLEIARMVQESLRPVQELAKKVQEGLANEREFVRGIQESLKVTVPGDEVFKLYDTFGFPVDLTRMMAEERGLKVDLVGFEKLMEQQREKARGASAMRLDAGEWTKVTDGADSRFEGYGKLSLPATVRAWRRDTGSGNAAGRVLMLLDQTPFYGEGGGQVGDQGRIFGPAGEWRVVDTQREGDRIVHIAEGQAIPDARPVTAEVDAGRRARTTLNHTSTHLLHAALREVLGPHVHQAGSIVHPDYLRFDYTHFEKPTDAQLDIIEHRVNRAIRANRSLEISQSSYKEAVDSGVVALFGEKYGDVVRVVRVPEFSAELCGGCHVRATGDIGAFVIVSETAIAAGVRRILAYTGEAAEQYIKENTRLVGQFRQILNVQPDSLVAKLEQVIEERKQLERELKQLKRGSLTGDADGLLKQARTINGVQVLASQVEAESLDELRGLADALRKKLHPGIAVIGSIIDGKASLLCAVSDDLVKANVKAGDLINKIAALADGRGGGPPHMATAGAKDASKLPLAVQQAPEIIGAYLAERAAK